MDNGRREKGSRRALKKDRILEVTKRRDRHGEVYNGFPGTL
jgi:hypothetical protein